MDLWAEKLASLALLAIAAAGWYAAALAATSALTASLPAPGRRAIGYAIGNLMIVVISIALGQPEIAIGILFASSVAALTLVLSIATISGITLEAPELPPGNASRRIWGFVFPVGAIGLLIGLHSAIGWMQATALATEGLVLLLLWNQAPSKQASVEPLPPAINAQRVILMLLALVAAAVASGAGIVASRAISQHLSMPGSGLITSLMLAPAVVLPMIGWSMTETHRGRYDAVVTTIVGFVLINLCALLPIAAGLWIVRPVVVAEIRSLVPHRVTLASATTSTTDSDILAVEPIVDRALPFPMGVWRVDTVLLVAVGFLLLPIALGRWSLGAVEGYGLLFVYVGYMMLTVRVAMAN